VLRPLFVVVICSAGGGCGGCKGEIEKIIQRIQGDKVKEAASKKPRVKGKLTNIQKIQMIQETINEQIRPALRAHGGNVELIDVDGNKVIGIEEKPENPKTDYAVIGIYMYDSRVFDIIKTLERSDRGELEITDVNNAYIKDGTMTCSVLDGWWIDAGSSPENLAKATQLVIKTGANNLT